MHDLGVVGLVFFEVFVPAEASWPPPGEEHFVDALPVGLGGALNTASVARALGLDVALISPRGAGLTDLAIAARVAALGLHDLPWPAPSNGAITLVRSTPHDRAFLSAIAPGTLAGCPPLPAARWIHVGGLGEAELLADRLAAARAADARVSVSAGWDPPRLAALRARLEAGSTPPWDLFFANAREAEALVGTAEGAEHLLAGRVATDVVVTCGAHGARAVLGGVRCAVAAEPVDVLDPTGAGDAFAAGVLAGCVQGLAPEACLALGARSATRVLGQRGGVVG